MSDATRPLSNRRKLIFGVGMPVAMLAFALFMFKWMVSNPPEIPQREVAPDYPTVEVITARPETIRLTVRSQGTVRPHTETSLKPEVSGRVVWISPSLVNGGVFAKDEKLLEIDATDYKSAQASSRTSQVRAEVELEHAERELSRMQSLYKQKLASKSQLDNARRSHQLAEAQHHEARINLERARIDMTRTVLKAPYTGRVRSENVDTGQFVARGEELAKIYATDYYEVHLPIGIEQFLYLDVPAETQGALPPDKQPATRITGAVGPIEFLWQGKLERTEGEIEAKTRLLYGVVRVENRNVTLTTSNKPQNIPLLVGQYVKAEIAGREVQNVYRLPRSALRNGDSVLIVSPESTLHFRDVKILRIQDNDVLISNGLNPGDLVCSAPPLVVVEGMQVNTAKVVY